MKPLKSSVFLLFAFSVATACKEKVHPTQNRMERIMAVDETSVRKRIIEEDRNSIVKIIPEEDSGTEVTPPPAIDPPQTRIPLPELPRSTEVPLDSLLKFENKSMCSTNDGGGESVTLSVLRFGIESCHYEFLLAEGVQGLTVEDIHLTEPGQTESLPISRYVKGSLEKRDSTRYVFSALSFGLILKWQAFQPDLVVTFRALKDTRKVTSRVRISGIKPGEVLNLKSISLPSHDVYTYRLNENIGTSTSSNSVREVMPLRKMADGTTVYRPHKRIQATLRFSIVPQTVLSFALNDFSLTGYKPSRLTECMFNKMLPGFQSEGTRKGVTNLEWSDPKDFWTSQKGSHTFTLADDIGTCPWGIDHFRPDNERIEGVLTHSDRVILPHCGCETSPLTTSSRSPYSWISGVKKFLMVTPYL